MLPLPSVDLRLPDGRLLRYDGPWHPFPTSTGHTWLTRNGLRAIVSTDATPHGHLRHVSASYKDRDPTWEELKALKAVFFGDNVDAAMILPRATDYVSGVPDLWPDSHVFHLWQLPVAWGIR